MNLKDKLAKLDHSYEAHQPQISEFQHEWIAEFQQELQIKVIQSQKSFVFLKENTLPLYNQPYYPELRENGFDAPQLRNIFGHSETDSEESQFNLSNILFIDTETTGLLGGTGTYPFLIGIGHLELDHMVVRQYLLPEFNHEWLMLSQINNALESFKSTISFNGKSFDLPLMRTRYLLNRIETPLDERLHLDLLHAARRIWKNRLPACNLQTIEREILGEFRVGDVPGEMIPHIYFEFIRKREAWMLRDVLEHNYYDIVNMMLLTIRMAAICNSPAEELIEPQDQLSFAIYLKKQKKYDEAAQLLKRILKQNESLSSDIYSTTLFLLSVCFKKVDKIELSKSCLLKLIEKNVLTPEVIDSLAKTYEHEENDCAAALEIVERGIQYIQLIKQLKSDIRLEKYLPKLKHRRTRLHRKLGLNSQK